MSDITLLADAPWVAPFLPTKLPKGWVEVERNRDGAAYIGPGKFSVIVSGRVESDGKRWLHVSCARPAYIPTWADLTWVKDTFIGPAFYAGQVFPPRDRWVNIHPHCLHLWACLDGWPLPEFSGFAGARRTI